MPTLIDSIRNDPKFNPQNSQKWFMSKVKEMTGGPRITSMQMLSMHQSQLVQKITPGEMFMFTYDPKTKNNLPYYDKFPLVIPFNRDADSFIGLNIHYLRPAYRLKLLDDLMQFVKNDRFGQPEKLKFQWSYISNAAKFPQVAPCVKRYLVGHVKSRYMKVAPEDWAMTCMLPTESWAKSRPY